MSRAVAICAGIAAAAATVVAAQVAPGRFPVPPPQRPTFRTGVELVHVDVVVFDTQTGKPVHGLTARDFTIIDRKRPQPITTFSEVNYEHDPAEPSLPPGLPLDVGDNTTAKATRIVLVVVDDLHIAKSLTTTAQEIVRRLLRDLGPQATVGLTFTSGRRGVELTEDRALVYQEIEEFQGRQARVGPPPPIGLNGRCGPGGRLSELASPDFWPANSLHQALTKAALVLGTETLRRKAFVLVSEGLSEDLSGLFETMQDRPEPICPNGSVPPAPHVDNDLLKMMDAMRRANVATYAINPEAAGRIVNRDGLGDTTLMTGDQGPRTSTLAGFNSPARLAKTYLDQLTFASGGFAITDSDALESGLATLLDDLDHYYMLGFQPTSTDKNWHYIDVKVDLPNTIVRARRGYRLGSETPPPKNTKEPLAGFAANVLPATDLPLKMFATPLPSPGRKTTRMGITMQIRADRAPLEDPDGNMRDKLQMLTMAVDLDTRKLTKTSIRRTRDVTLLPQAGAALGDSITYQIVSEWEVPPGHYQLRTTVQSLRLKKAGAVYLVVDVPDFNKATVALSGLVIGFADPTRRSVDGTAIEHNVLPLEPVLERVFGASDTLRVFYDVWRKTPADPATTTLEILDDARHFVREGAHDVPVGSDGHVDVKVALAGLSPGPYVLRISAGAADKVAFREVGFFVK